MNHSIQYLPLPEKQLSLTGPRLNETYRVLFFDPWEVYERILPILKTTSRKPQISITEVFPKNGNLCGCGCRNILSGRRTRWHTDECMRFAQGVWAVINGDFVYIAHLIRLYDGHRCKRCGCTESTIERGNGTVVSSLQLDHIIPVKHGGAGCWLNNYQFLCQKCHVIKTAEDFGHHKPKRKVMMPTLFDNV